MKKLYGVKEIGMVSLWFFAAYLLFRPYVSYFQRVDMPVSTGPFMVLEADSSSWEELPNRDSDWKQGFSCPSPNYWWQTSVELSATATGHGPLGLGIRSFFGAYEVFWDGEYIGSNGQPGRSKVEEVPGTIDRVFMLPESLSTPGVHNITVRVSQFQLRNHCSTPFLKLSTYDAQVQLPIILAALMHLLAGAFLVIGIQYGLIFLKSFRHLPFLLFSVLCFLLFGWMILEYLRFYYVYPYPLHYLRLNAISILTFLIPIITCGFFLYRFEIPFKIQVLGLQLIAQIIIGQVIFDYDLAIYYRMALGAIISTLACLWAWYRQAPFSFEATLSIIPLLAAQCFFTQFHYDLTLYCAFAVFIILNLYTLSKIIGRQRKNYEAALKQASLLKVELLKKNIQPHYLLNTLTSLISWVEESPRTAVRFIEALASEFEALRKVAEKDLIGIEEEIALCRSHLAVMGFRNEKTYKLKTEGVPEKESVPPAIFLTLLENALKHNIMEQHDVVFQLSFDRKKTGKEYTFFAPGRNTVVQEKPVPGTGWKYIHARLNSCYDQNWSMDSGPCNMGWKTVIFLQTS